MGQSAHSTINNTRESFGSHRAIYLTTLFQLVEQVELLLKGTSVPLLGASFPAPRAGLAGEMMALLPAGFGTAWAGNSAESGDSVVSAALFEHAGRHQNRYSRTTTCLGICKDSFQALAKCGCPQAPTAGTSPVTHPQTKDEEITAVTEKAKEQNLP